MHLKWITIKKIRKILSFHFFHNYQFDPEIQDILNEVEIIQRIVNILVKNYKPEITTAGLWVNNAKILAIPEYNMLESFCVTYAFVVKL